MIVYPVFLPYCNSNLLGGWTKAARGDRKEKQGKGPGIGLMLEFGRIFHCNLKTLKMFMSS